MLRPTKYSHPDKTVIYVSMIILKKLKENQIESFDKLLNYSKKNVVGGDVLFLPAINFLFLLGLVQYQAKVDSFEYIGKYETI